MSHTPGPWNVCELDFRAIEGPDGRIIADIRAPARENGREDARLIAAAPDLLKALEKAWIFIQTAHCSGLHAACEEEIAGALKKAEGEA
jgi:hypothetical protein